MALQEIHAIRQKSKSIKARIAGLGGGCGGGEGTERIKARGNIMIQICKTRAVIGVPEPPGSQSNMEDTLVTWHALSIKRNNF